MKDAGSMPKAGPVVVVGGINLDIQATSYAAFRPGDSNPGTVAMLPGGVGRNIAENLARLGCATELLTVFGDDEPSATLRESCAKLGIGVSGSLSLAETASSLYVCILGPEGRLVGAVAAMDAFERLEPAFLETRRSLLDSASAIVVDANIPETSIAWLAARYGRSFGEGKVSGLRPARGNEPPGGWGGRYSASPHSPQSSSRPLLFLDPVSVAKARRASACVGAFDFAKPNRAEAFALAGLDCADESPRRTAPNYTGGNMACDAANAADLPQTGIVPVARILHERGLGELYVSLGADGMYYSDGAISGIARADSTPKRGAPAFPPLVNVSGAGDAACAALVWSRLSGLDLRGRAAAALAAAAFCASSTRTVHPDLSGIVILNLAEGVIHEPLL